MVYRHLIGRYMIYRYMIYRYMIYRRLTGRQTVCRHLSGRQLSGRHSFTISESTDATSLMLPCTSYKLFGFSLMSGKKSR